MALFGSTRDAAMQIGVAQEFVGNVVTQQIGYYKVILPETPPNVYGEETRAAIAQTLAYSVNDRGADHNRTWSFKFFLEAAQIHRRSWEPSARVRRRHFHVTAHRALEGSREPPERVLSLLGGCVRSRRNGRKPRYPNNRGFLSHPVQSHRPGI